LPSNLWFWVLFLLLFTNVRFLQETNVYDWTIFATLKNRFLLKTNVYDWTIFATFPQILGFYWKPMLPMVWKRCQPLVVLFLAHENRQEKKRARDRKKWSKLCRSQSYDRELQRRPAS
jgi:hypothetical protein